jgi:molybdopterin-guanine dinucleotide biosynthesis protein A
MLGGQRLIDRAESSARQWSEILAVSVRDPGQVGASTLACIVDEAGIAGPLGGLTAALRFAKDSGCDAVLTIPADMPILPADLGERLAAEIGTHAAALARSGGYLHPVCGLWSTATLDAVPAYLASGKRSLKGLAETIGYAAVEWPDKPLDPFFNVNSAQDLAQAEQLFGTSISSE